MIKPHESQFTGCLIGQCLGDALGFIVEGYPPQICHQYVEDVIKTGKMDGQRRGRYPFGQYSDDSQLARELIQSYAACREFSPSDYADRIALIFKENRIVGRGRATEEAARRLIEGTSWELAGTLPPSAGNGSAMRAAPIGLIFHDDPERMIKAAHDQGRITHQDRRCSAGAIVIAGAVALVIRDKTFHLVRFLSQLSEWTRPFDGILADALLQMREWVQFPPDEAVHRISRVGLEPGYSDGWQGISPFVTSSVLWSLYAFLRSPDDYMKSVGIAIAVGGDVDTSAAMTGAINGARLGLDGIPKDLARYLNDRGTWNYHELVELARMCYSIIFENTHRKPV